MPRACHRHRGSPSGCRRPGIFRGVAIDSWERFLEVEALMCPGDVDLDPLDRAVRGGEPVDLELPDDARQTADCGTRGGHAWHLRHGLPPCDDCRAAHNEYMRPRNRAAGAARRTRDSAA